MTPPTLAARTPAVLPSLLKRLFRRATRNEILSSKREICGSAQVLRNQLRFSAKTLRRVKAGYAGTQPLEPFRAAVESCKLRLETHQHTCSRCKALELALYKQFA